MKASKVIEQIPEEIREYASVFVKSGEHKDPFAPPEFVQDIVWLARTKGSTDISDNVVAVLSEWLNTRDDALQSALGLIEQLYGKWSMPSPAEVAAGASLPPYITMDWFRLLMQPWSHKHGEAMERGWEWLRNN